MAASELPPPPPLLLLSKTLPMLELLVSPRPGAPHTPLFLCGSNQALTVRALLPHHGPRTTKPHRQIGRDFQLL